MGAMRVLAIGKKEDDYAATVFLSAGDRLDGADIMNDSDPVG